jgi:nucleoside phosphorylase
MNIKKPQNKEAEVKKPKIHIGAIGSGNQVVKNSEYRDSLFLSSLREVGK